MFILFRSIILLSNLHNKHMLAIFLSKSPPLDLLSPFDFPKNAGNFDDFSSFQHMPPLRYCYLVMLAVSCYDRNPSKLVPTLIIFQSPYLFIVEHGNQIFSHHDCCAPFYLSPLDFCSSSVFQ